MKNWVSAFSLVYYACKITLVISFINWAINS